MRETIFVAASLALILLSGCGDSSTPVTELSPEVLTEAQAIAPDKVYDLPELFSQAQLSYMETGMRCARWRPRNLRRRYTT